MSESGSGSDVVSMKLRADRYQKSNNSLTFITENMYDDLQAVCASL